MSKVILITGASTGIGAATAHAAVAAGHRVVLAARSADRLSALQQELGDNTLAVPTDVTNWDQSEALVTKAVEAYGAVDAVFANAGFGATRGWLNETPEHWRDMVLTNVLGAAYTARAAIPALKESKGHLLLTGSVAGTRPLPGSLYSATKFAVHAMGEAIRLDLTGTGVRTTIVAPGMVDTPFFERRPSIEALHADDVANAVLYAIGQPAHVDVNLVVVRPTAQEG